MATNPPSQGRPGSATLDRAVVDPHDKTVLARDLQIPEELEEESFLDGDIVLPDLDAPAQREAEPTRELERLSIPELERISIPALEAEAPRGAAPASSPGAIPKQAKIPSLPATPRPAAAGKAPGSGTRAAVAVDRQPDFETDEFNPPSSRLADDFDEDFETFQAGGFTNVQAQLLETVQVPKTEPEVPWPSGNSPDYGSLMVDPLDARVQANFGDAPESPLRAPEYTVKVFRRRLELKRELAASRARSKAADIEREESLAALAFACRGLDKDGRFKSYFEKLQELEKVARERNDALAGDNQQFQSEVAKFDQAASEVNTRTSQAQAELGRRQQKLGQVQQLLTRTEVQYKRLLIEIRSLKTAEEEAGLKGKPIDHSERIAALMGKVPAHQAAVKKRTADRAEAQGQVDTARKELERIEDEERKLKKQRGEVEKTFRQRLGVRSQGVQETQQEITAEAARAARALLAQRSGGVQIPKEHLEAVRSADDAVLKELKAQRLLESALDTYDRRVYTQGRNVIIGSAVVLLLVILMQVMGSGSSDGSNGEEQPTQDESEEDTRISTAASWFYA